MVYVSHLGPSEDRTGATWVHALESVREAANVAESLNGCDLWVAQGTYYTYETNTSNTILLTDDVGIYGGFVGNETSREERDPQNNVTILNGTEQGSPGNHVTTIVKTYNSQNVVLDGLTLTQGQGNLNSQGGALNGTNSTLLINHCLFLENTAEGRGGAVHCDECIH